MAESETLKNMIMAFRVSELQLLLGFAGRNKLGRKTDLQQRALKLLKLRSTPVQMKIRELYKSIPHNGLSVPPDTVPSTSNEYFGDVRSFQANPAAVQSDAPLDMSAFKNYIPHPPWSYYQPPMQMLNDLLPSAPSPQEPLTTLHPNVKFKTLPFYEVMGELLKPSALVPIGSQRFQENNFAFKLTEAQVGAINDLYDLRADDDKADNVQVQIRFCVSDTTCEQDDCFPSGINVKLNNSICALPNLIPTNKPGVEPKRPPRPVDGTMFIKLHADARNILNVSWNSEPGKGFCVVVHFVRKLTADDLLRKLDVRGMRAADYTRKLVKDKLDEDLSCGIATSSIRVSLACPLLKRRIIAPCRPAVCTHVPVFDASTFLMMNEKKPSWMCPICDKKVTYKDLLIDEYFKNVLTSPDLPGDVMEIQLLENGTWSLLVPKKEDNTDSRTERSRSPVLPVIHNVTSLADSSLFGTNEISEQVDSTVAHDDEIVVIANGSDSNPASTVPAELNDKQHSKGSSAPGKIAVPPKKRKVCVVDLTSDTDDEGEEDPLVDSVARKVSKLGTSISKTSTSSSSSPFQPDFYQPAEFISEENESTNNCEEIDLTDD